MTFETFPYANMQDLNIDWILAKLKELERRINDIEVKDYDEIIRQILIRLSAAEEQIINNFNILSNRIDNLTQIVNSHYLELSQQIITINQQINIINQTLDDYLARILLLELKVDGMYFEVVDFDTFEHMPHLPMHQYWVTDGSNLELWLGDQQLKFGIPLYRTVLTTIQNTAPVFGASAITTIEEAL